jgi:hypothetical protein
MSVAQSEKGSNANEISVMDENARQMGRPPSVGSQMMQLWLVDYLASRLLYLVSG